MKSSGQTTRGILDGKPVVLQTIIPNKIVRQFPEAVADFKAEMEITLRGFNQRVKALQITGEAKFGASTKVKGEENKSVFLATMAKQNQKEGGDIK